MALRVDQACMGFEAAWREGGRPRIQDYLGDAAGAEREALLRELTRLEAELRGRAGEQPTTGDDRDHFPSAEREGRSPASTTPDPPRDAAVPPAAARGCELLEEIGKGGIGVVHRGRDRGLRRELAVKLLRDEHRDNPDLRRRFVEEAQIGGQLQHPGVAPVYELGEFPDGRPYFTMKLIRGRTLADLLKQRKGPGEDRPRFTAILEQVCQTLAYAHAHGVIHRDLKPANVMVGEFGEVQVMDWGMAKVLASRRRQPPEDAGADAPAGEKRMVVETLRDDATRDGAVMGTYAYMPPEQARGETARLDERCDVFGLGAILCGILTGSPAYTGAPSEVARKAEAGDLADAYARLDGCGADPELVRLARSCLAAEPEVRPQDAGAVATAVTAYRAGVQERLRVTELERAAAQAREAEAKAKAKAERRARRVTVGLAASALLTAALLGGGGGWLWRRQAETTVAVEVDLGTATAAAERGDDQAAREALERADGRLAGGGFDDLRRRVEALRGELNFAALLENIRSEEAEIREGGIGSNWKAADSAYAAAFRSRELVPERLEAVEAGDLIGASPVRERIIAALDNWAILKRAAGQKKELAWMLEAARRADPDERRALLRDEAMLGNAGRLKELATRPEVADWPPASAVALATALQGVGEPEAAGVMLQEVQLRHPGDFWVNVKLADCLSHSRPSRPGEAVSFARAATAARPRSVMAHVNLGVALADLGQQAAAEREYHEALRIKPDDAYAHNNLGAMLAGQGKAAEAEKEYREALRLLPDLPEAHYNLGCVLSDMKRPAEAEQEYHKAIDLRPDYCEAHYNLGNALIALMRPAEAETEFRKAIDLKPDFPEAHYNLGNALRGLQSLAEAVEEYRKATALRPDHASAYNNLGGVLRDLGKPAEAVPEFRKAIDLKPDLAQAHFNLGAALLDLKRPAEAAEEFRKALALQPDDVFAHANLGWALYDLKRPAEAAEEFRKAIELRPDAAEPHFDLGVALDAWKGPAAAVEEYRKAIALEPDLAKAHYNLGIALRSLRSSADAAKEFRKAIALQPDNAEAHCNLAWALCDLGRFAEALPEFRRGNELGVMRPDWTYPSAEWVRMADRLAELNSVLPAVLRGAAEPAGPSEGAAMARMCQDFKRRYVAAARLYADAFAAEPRLAVGRRYNAACAAALAAAGQGDDADTVADEERDHLRRQAFAWLRDDLTEWARLLDGGDARPREAARRMFAHWKEDMDLASVRDPDALDRLPEADRDAWRKLWANVDAVLQKTAPPM
jgi:serine/threonine-protein kinase